MSSFEKTVGDIPLPHIRYRYDHEPQTYRNDYSAELPGYNLYHSLTYSKEAREFRSKYVEWSPDMTKLLPEETANNLAIPLSFRSLKEYGLMRRAHIGGIGATRYISAFEIAIDPKFNQNRISFGHELGHYFIQEVMDFRPHPWEHFEEEEFCEYFARTLAIPEAAIHDIDMVDEEVIKKLIVECDVDPHAVILRLIEAGKLPDNVHIDSYTPHGIVAKFASKIERSSVCLRCTAGHGGSDCPHAHLAKAALFDFTDRAWSDKFSHCSGEFDLKARVKDHRFLTHYYQSRMSQLALFPPMAPAPYHL